MIIDYKAALANYSISPGRGEDLLGCIASLVGKCLAAKLPLSQNGPNEFIHNNMNIFLHIAPLNT